MNTLSTYLPQDRRRALADGQLLPETVVGSALFADISGFTPLFASLADKLGPRRAAEEMTHLVNQVYETLISQVEQYDGSVIDFVGDAITCWFEDDQTAVGGAAPRAATCALAMQQAMTPFANVAVLPGVTAVLTIKIGLAAGPARRFVVGDPALRQMGTLAGETMRQMSLAEGLAQKGEIILAPTAVAALAPIATLTPTTTPDFAILHSLSTHSPLPAPYSALPTLHSEILRPWLLPPLYERLQSGQSEPLPELRPVVALFLRFTGIEYDHDPAAGEKLDAFIRWVQHTAVRHDGHLIQLTIGDKGSFLYVAFGALTAHDDAAVRAVRAAAALLAPPPALAFITPQIGLAGGPARTGTYGSATRRTFGAIGGDVVLAARLMVAAPPGEMRCAHSVYHQVGGKIAFESLPPVRVKGRADLIRVYQPLTGDQRPTASHLPEMVGRQAEIALMESLLTAVQGGASRVLVIEGEAGIGKSRLVAELARQLHDRGLTGLAGAGQSIEQQTPYRAWRDVLASYLDLEQISDVVERRARLETLAAQLIPAHVHRLPVFNDVLGLNIPENDLTRGLDANLRQQNVTLLVTTLLRAWTDQRPLILVLEDAHWLDMLSWQLTRQVARALSLANAPFLLVLVQRPLDQHLLEGETAVHPILAELRALPGTQTLTLAALAPNDIAALIANRLRLPAPALPAPLVDLVQTRANGNPFFAEELLINLSDTGIIRTTDNACHITGDLNLALHTLPDTLHGLILARMDRLPPQSQFVIKAAAVIGRAFAFTPLHYVISRYEAWITLLLRDHLAALTQADLTLLEALEPDITYLFKHIITQEAAYQTLLFAQRRALHRLVGEWYESQFGDETTTVLPLLAYHYRYAEDAAKERHYLRLAGAAAEKVYANEAAIGFYTRLLTLLPPPEQAEILLRRGAVQELAGQWETARGDYQAGLARAEEATAVSVMANCQYALGALCRLRGEYPAALDWLAQARAAFTGQNNQQGLINTALEMGFVWMQQGDYARARQEAEAALALGRALGDQAAIEKALSNLGKVALLSDALNDAQTFFEASLAVSREIDNRWRIGVSLTNLGSLASYRNDYEAARSLYEEALTLTQEIGDKQGVAMLLNNLGILATRHSDGSVARQLYMESLALKREMGDKPGIAATLDNLGLVLQYLGEMAQAQALHEEVLALQQEIGDKRGIAAALNKLGLVLQRQGDLAAAQVRFEESLALRREIGEKRGVAFVLADLGGVAREAGDYERALSMYGESLQLWLSNKSAVDMAGRLIGLARVVAERPSPDTDTALTDARHAAWLLAVADVVFKAHGAVMNVYLRQAYDAAVTAVQSTLGAAFAEVWREGEQMTPEAAVKAAFDYLGV